MTEPAKPAWKDLPVGAWFFEDSPSCTNRYSVQERTHGGCSIVCSTPYHYEQAKRNMQQIAELHNRSMEAIPAEQPDTRARDAADEYAKKHLVGDWERRLVAALLRDFATAETASLRAENTDLREMHEATRDAQAKTIERLRAENEHLRRERDVSQQEFRVAIDRLHRERNESKEVMETLERQLTEMAEALRLTLKEVDEIEDADECMVLTADTRKSAQDQLDRYDAAHPVAPHVSVAYNHETGEKVVTPDPCHDPALIELSAATANLILAKARFSRAKRAVAGRSEEKA